MTLHLDYPFSTDAAGRSARTTDVDHIRDLVEQVLFTTPGERVNRPDFGTGVMQLVFGASSDQVAGAVEYTLQAALQRWLADLITVQKVGVRAEEATLFISVEYAVLPSGEPGRVAVERRTVA